MRRIRAGKAGAMTGESGGEQGFWPSYADMMSAIALILFFLMLLSYIQNLITGNDLQNTQKVLEDTKLQLSETQDSLALTLVQVDEAESKLSDVTAELDSAQLTLDLQQKEIAGYSAKIDEQTETIASQEKLIADQGAYLNSANKQIKDLQTQMKALSEVAVIRLSILQEMSDKIAKVMGSADKVTIGDNGNIILGESVLFDVGSAAIKGDSKVVLDELIDVFTEFLSDPNNAKYVDSIVIAGHTDSTGTDESNRVLSTNRANSVLGYLLTGKNAKLNTYAQYFCAAGYGETRPAKSNDTEAGRAANRRIEISIILKDDTVLDIVEEYLALDTPTGGNG